MPVWQAVLRYRRLWPIPLFVLGAITFTWPLVLHIGDALPLGSEQSPTVPLFNLWTLGWNADRLLHGYQDYWDAPIFYPVPNTFAFSDPQPLTGLLVAPIWHINPALAYNFVLLLFLVLNGLSAYKLLLRLDLGFTPPLIGGLLVMTLPFLTHERGVLQLLPVFGVLLAIDGLWSLTDAATWQAGLQVGLGIAITFLTSEYYALVMALLMLPGIPFLLPQVGRRSFWFATGLAVTIALLFTLPVILPQQAALEAMGFSRTAVTIARGSAELSDYLRPSDEIWTSEWFPLQFSGDQRLYPGIMLLALGIAGGIAGLGQKRHRKWTLYLLAATTVAFLISLGLNLRLGNWQPYDLLRRFVTGFDNLRSPFRAGHFVQLYLVLLAMLFMGWLGRQRRRYQTISVILIALTLLEIFPRPARLALMQPTFEDTSFVSPAIFLPFAPDRSAASFVDTTAWMVASLADPVVLVNGYSGYFPIMQSQLRTLMDDFPTPGGLAALQALGVRTIVIREGWLDENQKERLADRVGEDILQQVGQQADYLIYRLPESPLRSVQTYTGGWAVDVELAGETILLNAYAAVPDSRMYVLAPGVAPLYWHLSLTATNGRVMHHAVSLSDAVLLYHGSDRRLRVSVPRPKEPGKYGITLSHSDTGQVIAKTSLTIP